MPHEPIKTKIKFYERDKVSCTFLRALNYRFFKIVPDLIYNLFLGKIGITIDTFWYEPATDSEEDEYLTDLVLQMNVGIKTKRYLNKNIDAAVMLFVTNKVSR